MSLPLLSIVSVTYKDDAGLQRTLRSLDALRREAGSEVEHIIVDGAAQVSVGAVSSVTTGQVVLISEPDRGIYDGMNKGLAISRGAHVWFLNGGDEAASVGWHSLRHSLLTSPRTAAFHSYALVNESRVILRHPKPLWWIQHALPTSHQAIIYPGDLARRAPYDLSYAMSADYAFTAHLIKNGMSVRYEKSPLGLFHLGGVSDQKAYLIARDAARVQREILQLQEWRVTLSMVLHFLSRQKRRLFRR